MSSPAPVPQYLIVDDDQVSVMAMQRMIRKHHPTAEMEIAHDGEEALQKIRALMSELGQLPPLIVTLDLNMPRMNGIEFLQTVRADPVLAKLVVFVFSTSDAHSDIQAAFAFNPAGYVVKESGTERFADALQMLVDYATSARLPV